MEIVFKLLAVMLVIVAALKYKIALGNAMLAAAALLWLLVAPQWTVLRETSMTTLLSAGTWKLLLAMYLVMCLEHQLRTSGILEGFMLTAKRTFNEKVLLAIMPTLIGFLPSLGGAIMSCPMVDNAAKQLAVSPEQKSTINYWFRHFSEYGNPIVPGMMLASEILRMPLRDLLFLIAPAGFLSFILGWLVLITPIKDKAINQQEAAMDTDSSIKYVFLALGPIALNLLLVIVLNFSAASSLAIVIAIMSLVLRYDLTAIKYMIQDAYHANLLWGVFGVICFQNMFNISGAVAQFLNYMGSTAVPVNFVLMIIAFIGGLLCGVGQSVVALAFPIIAAMGTLDPKLIFCTYVFGTAGQMMSPAHLCYSMTVEYFRADMIRSMYPVIAMELVMMLAAFIITQVIL